MIESRMDDALPETVYSFRQMRNNILKDQW